MTTDLATIRQRYPQYADISDEQLVRGLHSKHYSDMEFDTFAQRVGYTPSVTTQQAPSRQATVPAGMPSVEGLDESALGVAPTNQVPASGNFQFTDTGRPIGPIEALFTGHGKIPEGAEELPSFQAREATPRQQIRIAAGYLLSADPQKRMEILQETLGDDVSFREDDKGNILVRYGDEEAFLNRPGFDMDDALSLTGEILQFAPAAKISAIVGRAVGWAGRIAAGAGGAGVTQTAREMGAVELGAEDVSGTNIALATAFGAGGEGLIGAIQRFTPQAREVIRRAREDIGLNLRASPGQQIRQVQEFTEGRVPSTPGVTAGRPVHERAVPYDELQARLQHRRTVERAEAGAMFDAAREANTAYLRPSQVTSFRDGVRRELDMDGFDVEVMNHVQRRLNDLTEILSPEGGRVTAVNLNAMERWRRRVTKSQKDAVEGSSEEAALIRMKSAYDDWLEGQYIDDMISGDPRAVRMWQEARAEWGRISERFDTDRTMGKIIFERNATPEQMRQWLFGVSATKSPAQAGEAVRRLNTIFGKESEMMGRVRGDFMLDIVDPLLGDRPNLTQFIKNYDDLIAKRPTLVRELFGPEGLKDWDDLVALTRGVAQRSGADITVLPQDFMGKLSQFMVRMTIGHGIAKGGARVSLGTGILDRLRVGTAGRYGRRQILEEYLGVYPMQPLVPHGTGTILGGITGPGMFRGQGELPVTAEPRND